MKIQFENEEKMRQEIRQQVRDTIRNVSDELIGDQQSEKNTDQDEK